MDIQPKIIAMWDRASKAYDTHTGHGLHDARERAAWTDALRSLLPPPPLDVLDAGTGTGVIALLFAELGYRVRGVDLSEKMLAQARRKAADAGVDIRFELADAAAPPGAPESVDIVFSRHVIHLLPDPLRALASWFGLVRRGGRIIIVDGLWGQDTEDTIDPDIQAALPLRAPDTTMHDIRGLVEQAGFVNVAIGDLAEIDGIEHELATAEEPAPNVPHYVITACKP